MDTRALTDWIAERKSFEYAADWLQPALKCFFGSLGPARRGVKNFLHGTWLGHPLHPVLTDVPLGAWTATLLLDAFCDGRDRSGLERAADATLVLGLAGAAGSAATGLTDWGEIDARPRRLGVAHAALNVGATVLFGASLISRRAGCRRSGKALAAIGYLATVAAAYLGGDLVYHEQIGVDHSSGRELPDDFHAVIADADLPDGKPTRATFKETPLLLVRRGARVFALAETCAHLGGPLAEGKLEGNSIVCPWHASRFDLATGRVLDGPATFPQPCLQARIRDGRIEVRVRC